jgi:hypothetical protein
MVIKDNEFIDIPTPAGPMRTHVLYPVAEGRYPGIVSFSEIFQVTEPIRRSAAVLAGHGFVVVIPENSKLPRRRVVRRAPRVAPLSKIRVRRRILKVRGADHRGPTGVAS